MKFIIVRDLRGRSGQVWTKLAREREVVLTSNGKPIAILSASGATPGDDRPRTTRIPRLLPYAIEASDTRTVEKDPWLLPRRLPFQEWEPT